MNTIAPTPADIARFNARATKDGDCLLWDTPHSTGYGYFYMKTDGPVQHRAHRIAYIIAHGEIPEGMQVDHTCYRKACVNPDHLRLTTHKQNQENRPRARRGSSSGIRGVYWDKQRGKWGTCITHNNKRISAGRYATVEEAEAAVTAKRNELFTHNNLDRVA
jgi:hypothetical protein